jgi:hypothetical protein
MAAIIIATAGAANANAYCTLAEANTYHSEKRMHSEAAWQQLSNDLRNRAIIWATRLLDEQINWVGSKASSTQILRWPRNQVWDVDAETVSASTIPTFLKDATAEYAYHLSVEDRTEETNRDLQGFKYMKIGDLSLVVDPYTGKPVIPPSVWTIINHYGSRSTKKKTLVRM